MKPNLNIEKSSFTNNDIDLLTYEILPKTKKNVFYGCLIFFLLIPIMPFLPARITARSAIQTLNYETALVMFVIVNGLVIFGIYYLGIVLLNKDINEGYKYVYRTKILNKTWKGDNEFKIEITERPKNVTEKITSIITECNNWLEGDFLEIEYLQRTGRILSYTKIEV